MEADRIARAFFTTAGDGDAAALSALLAREVEIHSDGSGKDIAFRNDIRGIDRAPRLFAELRRKYKAVPSLLRTATINGLSVDATVDADALSRVIGILTR